MEIEKIYGNFIITGMSFESKMDCFEHFKELIKEDTFELVNENTERVPLNKVNELLEEDYIYINIINETKLEVEPEEDGECENTFENDEKIWIRNFFYSDEYMDEYFDSFYNASYVFLFKEKNEKYKFLGLYKFIETDIDRICSKWERKEENIIVLDKSQIINLIQNINYSYIKEYINDREKLKEVLKKYGDRYEYLPDNLKNDKELCLISLESTNGIACKFAGKELLNSKEFAKKVLKKYPHCLEYFLDKIKDDLEICKSSIVSYRDMSQRIRNNKELVLKIVKEQPYDIKYIDKEIRKDKDICESYWKYVKEENKSYSYFSNICSVIGIDTYGNEVIDVFLSVEKERHLEETIFQYEEETELVQFIKTELSIVYPKQNPIISIFNKEIFDKDLEPFIILIGEKENIISRQIKTEYELSDNVCIIEIYKEDCSTNNIKLITKDINEIIDLLRIVTYDLNSKNMLIHDDYLYELKNYLKVKKACRKNIIKIHKFEGTIKEVKKQINEIELNRLPKINIVQLVYNPKLDLYTINNIYNMLYEAKYNNIVRYYSNHMCNIKDIELIMMSVD